MPKFHILKEGVNETLINATREKITTYLSELFEPHELVEIDGMYSFSFGTVTVCIRVVPWHSDDALVSVFSYLADNVTMSPELSRELLHLNATIPFGGFGVSFESVVFTYSLAAANIDFNEFSAAVQTVAYIADEYDEMVKEMGQVTPV
jgi:hypothetical protein